jgi:hypothetical protein
MVGVRVTAGSPTVPESVAGSDTPVTRIVPSSIIVPKFFHTLAA